MLNLAFIARFHDERMNAEITCRCLGSFHLSHHKHVARVHEDGNCAGCWNQLVCRFERFGH